MKSDDVGIIGYGSSVYEKNGTQPTFAYLADAAAACLENAGIAKSEVDGIALSSFHAPPDNAVTLGEYLGMELNWAHFFTAASAGPVCSVMEAIRAVESGVAKCVLVLGGDSRTMDDFRHLISRFNYAVQNYAAPLNFGGMNGFFSMIQRRHMHEYGTKREQLGRIAVAQRYNALRNPKSLFKKALTLDEYLNARMIADPIRLFDCPMPASGADAILVAPLDRARPGKGVRLLSGFQRHNHLPGELTPLRGGWETFRDKLFDEAGVTHQELDLVQLYDDYPIMVSIQIEDLGFCPKGEVGPFLDRHTLSFDGTFPLNTSGGQLSCAATAGGGGLIGVLETVCQLNGEAGERQVRNARTGLVSGFGMVSYGHGLSSSAVILQKAGN
ncbi:thiolase family protein [Variovorax boronicumulans]|uniref:thiolase family protein n=1 Tax=Variovorax boronicumulans TaxID=436515 RepID=UPI001C56063B